MIAALVCFKNGERANNYATIRAKMIEFQAISIALCTFVWYFGRFAVTLQPIIYKV